MHPVTPPSYFVFGRDIYIVQTNGYYVLAECSSIGPGNENTWSIAPTHAELALSGREPTYFQTYTLGGLSEEDSPQGKLQATGASAQWLFVNCPRAQSSRCNCCLPPHALVSLTSACLSVSLLVLLWKPYCCQRHLVQMRTTWPWRRAKNPKASSNILPAILQLSELPQSLRGAQVQAQNRPKVVEPGDWKLGKGADALGGEDPENQISAGPI
jgi:hypothetical protein